MENLNKIKHVIEEEKHDGKRIGDVNKSKNKDDKIRNNKSETNDLENKPSKHKKAKYEIDMCNGPILGKMLRFSIPLMFSSVLQLLFNAADIVVVGKFAGDNALAAVGSNTSLISLLTNLFIGLSIGANVVVAQNYGAKKDKDLSETVHTAMLLSMISGIILTVVGAFGAKQILIWMQSPAEVLGLATIYLRIYFLGMTATMIYNFGSAILRAIGDTKRPLYFLTVAGIVNVILNLVFVILFQLGVAGVAIATVISQCISAFLIVRCLCMEHGAVQLNLKQLHIYKDKLLRIMKVGLPAGFQGIVFALSNVMIQSSINSFGAITVAGNSAAANIEGFIYVAMNSFYQATISFTSQNVGARKNNRINPILLCGEFCVIVTGLILGFLCMLFGSQLLSLYTDHADVVAAGMSRLRVIARTYALCGMMDVIVGSLRGIGYSVLPMIVSLIGACGLRLLWLATLFQIPQFHSISMLYLSYPISWIITFSAHLICYLIIRFQMRNKESYHK